MATYHLSMTRSGICPKTGAWKPIYFKTKETEAFWRYAIITLLREQYGDLDPSAERYTHIREERVWSSTSLIKDSK